MKDVPEREWLSLKLMRHKYWMIELMHGTESLERVSLPPELPERAAWVGEHIEPPPHDKQTAEGQEKSTNIRCG